MIEPFSSILHKNRQNLAETHKFAIGIMETRDFDILTINCSMILKEKIVKIVDTRW